MSLTENTNASRKKRKRSSIFAASLGEFGAIITFVSNIPGETRTLPLAIYTAIQTPGGETAAARLAALSIALAVTGLVLAEVAAQRVRRLAGR